jgi:ribose-phosphate pyrophosphokinase
MSEPLIVCLPGNLSHGSPIAAALSAPVLELEVHRFPDGESLVRYPASIAGRDIVLFCTLDRPDEKFLPLLFAAETARGLGARSLGLVAPYLCYMRQDQRFHAGETLSAKVFASTLSRAIDWLVTIDPHLHRLLSLSDIFSVPATAMHADRQIAAWIAQEVHNPLLIGPDWESAQWVNRVAALIKCPATILTKVREGDREVSVSIPDPALLTGRTPVVLDDIISTEQTMKKAVLRLIELGAPSPICLGVHAVFAGTAYHDLLSTGAQIVTTNTIAHCSNQIDILPMIGTAIVQQLHNLPHH